MVRGRILIAFCLLGLMNFANAAEQWEWNAEIRNRYSNVVIASDPQTYPNQFEAAAAMRQLGLPGSTQLAISAPGQGNANDGTIEIDYFAPTVPIAIGESEYDVDHNPIAGGFPYQIENPIFPASEDELADSINEWHKSNGPAVCANRDYNIELEESWGPWVAGSPHAIARRFYTYDLLGKSVGPDPVCYFIERSTNVVYRVREETCPADYTKINHHDPNVIGDCEYTRKGVVMGPPHQCELTPVSTLVGNPCDTATGAKTETEVDYSSDTVRLVRYYNSHAQTVGSFGPGWMHNYDRRMSISRDIYGNPVAPTMLLRPSGVANLLRHTTSSGGSVWQSTSGNGLHVKQDGSNYRTYLNSGATELYDSSGYLIGLVDPAGRITTVNRDPNGLVTQVVLPFGKTLTFHYDSESKLVSIDDPAGNAIHYGYGGAGELISVTYQDNTTKQYHYENPDFPYHLTGITDENGDRFATYAYDEIGRSILTSHAGNSRWHMNPLRQ